MKTMKSIYKRFTKKILLSILMVNISLLGFATTYYVSNAGNDSNSGLTATTTWQTLAKVNASTFKAGDQILFQKGDTFYGSLKISQSGSPGNPITIGAYGTGVNPVISGFTTVLSWTNLGGSIWESESAVSNISTCAMVAINGVNTGMGRWPNLSDPNSGYSIINSHPTSTSLTSTSLTGTTDWTGAEVVSRTGNYTISRATISAQSINNIEYTPAMGAPVNWGFFIQNHPSTLDQQNEWYFNSTTKKIRVYSTSEPTNVKVASIDNVVTFSQVGQVYVSLDGLTIEGANNIGIYRGASSTTGDNLTIKNCSILFSGVTGIQVKSNYLTIENCIISDSNNKAVDFGALQHGIFRNNTITNSGIIEGMGTALGGTNSAISMSYSHYSICEYNIISNSGLNGITFYGHDITIKNNLIDSYCMVQDDGAGIYTFTGTPNQDRPVMENCRITGNIILNGIGAKDGTSGTFPTMACGIYLDYWSENVEIDNNSIANSMYYGMMLGQPKNINMHHNTIYNSSDVSIRINNRSDVPSQTYNILFNDNILLAKNSKQQCVLITSTVTNIPLIGNFNSNYYCRPIEDSDIIRVEQPGIGGTTGRTLEYWQTFSGQDANSYGSPQTIGSENDLQFEYNATSIIQTVTLNQQMIDVKGTKYASSVTLQPYTSIVLMKDNNPAITSSEYKSICEGLSYNGWTISGTYERTLTAKSGSDSIVTTYLTVNPNYSITENVTISEGESYQEWITSGSYSRTFPSVSGCDSTIVTNLTVEKNVTKQAEILPTHYIPVWQGENGLNHMNIMVVSAILEDIPLKVNDEIAVFDGLICVGSMKLSKAINAGDNTTFLTIPASQNDGSNNGFNDQDTIIFKIWDDLNQTEMLVNTISYRNDVPSWITSGKYAAGSTSVVELISFVEFTQTIDLIKGYNLISTFVEPSNSDASAVTQALCEAGSLVKIQDEAGKSLEDWGNFGGWINQLGSIQNSEGYKIKVANNCTLQVTGRPIALPLDIPLKTGWNIISFPRTDMIDALSIVQSLIDQNVLVKVQDELGNSIENWGIFGGWKNGIGSFIPGKAYKVKLSADAVLTIQENYIKSAVLIAHTEETEYFSSDIVGNGSDHMNINLVGLQEAGLSAGDELAAFDGNICVGTLKITENHLIDGTAALVASFSSDEQNPDGFTVGHPIQILAWNQVDGNEISVDMEVLIGQAQYAKNSSVLVRMKSITTEISRFDDLFKIDVFPNPCHGKFTVRFSNLPNAGSQLEILDIAGRIIVSRMITGMNEEFNLDHQASGLYLVKSVINSKETIQKLIVN